MYNNYSLRQNMQIPHENVYTGVKVNTLEEDIEILSKNYEIHNLQEVKKFLERNNGLVSYIHTITPLINNHFPDYNKCITFSQDPEFEELNDITIFINTFKATFDDDWKELDKLESELFYMDEFSTKLKGLISVDLWLK